MASFFTIQSSSEGLFQEKGSRFLAFAFPVGSEEEVKERLAQLRKTHHDARHHCYAYRIGLAQQLIRASDDGEPNHSAGDPILGQIRSHELTNVLVVVVRYFGGIKLGVGGLIKAYRQAADEALRHTTKVEIFEKQRVSFRFSYEQTAVVERTLHPFEPEYLQQVYESDCFFTCLVRKEQAADLREKLGAIGIETPPEN